MVLWANNIALTWVRVRRWRVLIGLWRSTFVTESFFLGAIEIGFGWFLLRCANRRNRQSERSIFEVPAAAHPRSRSQCEPAHRYGRADAQCRRARLSRTAGRRGRRSWARA